MHRLIVVILSAVDAAIAAAVGIAATLAPLTLLWVLGMGAAADWGALWPASATIWQFGNLVPLQVTLPGDYLAVAGIDLGAASFVLSLAPLAFAGFTAIFAARSGVRASQADAWITGVITGSVVFAALATLIALSSANPLAAVEQWQAILFPSLVFTIPLLIGAFATEWREASSGFVARLRDRIEAAPHGWGEAPGLIALGTSVVLTGLIGLGALMVAVSLVLRGGEVIALFEAAQVDALGATVVTLGQLAYLPTLAIWGMAFVAGPGFAVGTGTAVSPAGTQLGMIPGIPILGVLPESTTPWLLLLALLPVALGALAGWIARSRLVAPFVVAAGEGARDGSSTGARGDADESRVAAAGWDASPESARSSALTALLAGVESSRAPEPAPADGAPGDATSAEHGEAIGARFVIALGIAVLAAAGAALFSVLASGSIGPGRLAEVGPQPGAVALAVGLEVLLGAAILLLSPRPPERRTSKKRTNAEASSVEDAEPSFVATPPRTGADGLAETDTEPIAVTPVPASARPVPVKDNAVTADLGRGRPQPLPAPQAPPPPPID